MASILDFTRDAITKVRPGHTPMSDMLGNPIVHTKVMILLPLKKMILIVKRWILGRQPCDWPTRLAPPPPPPLTPPLRNRGSEE